MMVEYVGVSTAQFEQHKEITLTDVNLINQDIMNHIFTRKYGGRVKMPLFGTRIPDILFDPLDDISITIIDDDLTEVFTYDPRVELIDLQIIPDFDKQTIWALATLHYIYINFTDRLDIKIEFNSI